MKFLGRGFNLKHLFARPERRQYERARVFEALYVDYLSENPPLKGTSEARDISLGGIRFLSNQKIKKGTVLTLTLRFAPGSTLTTSLAAQARVVRCEKKWGHKFFRVGCQFMSLDKKGYDEIETFIHWVKDYHEKNIFFRYGDV